MMSGAAIGAKVLHRITLYTSTPCVGQLGGDARGHHTCQSPGEALGARDFPPPALGLANVVFGDVGRKTSGVAKHAFSGDLVFQGCLAAGII